MTAYAELEARFRRIDHVGGALAVLHWDSATMMPPGGAAARAEQLATLTLIRHELLADPATADLLDAAEQAGTGGRSGWRAANLHHMRREWRHATAVPADLTAAFSHATSACELAWRRARDDRDFAAVAPLLAEVLRLVREIAAAKAAAFGCGPYDALLDAYDAGARIADIETIFADLEAFLPGFLERTLAHQAARPAPLPLDGPFPVAAQRNIAERLMAALGFEAEHGRLDVSHHPFSGGVPDDVRITTRYLEHDFSQSLMAVLHETGHALYERGLPPKWRDQPVGQSAGMTLHESQSLLVEMHVCRSAEFISYLAPLVRKTFGASGPAWGVANLRRLYWRVGPGLIRVEADEVTYPLHVILRTRLERAMIAGDLTVAELPGAWREAMKATLGIVPDHDGVGCLQDIHWYGGDFGYFPTYTLGALAAAQLFAAAKAADADILPAIAEGRFAPLLAWLRTNVHAHGSRYPAREVLRRATGEALGTAAYERHVAARYLA